MSNAYETFEDLAKDSFQYCEDNSEHLWVMLIDGRRVSTRSYKSLWHQKSHAINALHNHLSCTAVQNLWKYNRIKKAGMSFTGDEIKEAKKRWMDQHAEIITLKAWEERRRGG